MGNPAEAGSLRVTAGEGSWLGCQQHAAYAMGCGLVLQKLRAGSERDTGSFRDAGSLPCSSLGCAGRWWIN